MEGEDWNNFVFRTFCQQWFPEQEASEALFFGRFRHAQVPVLVHLMKQEMLTESTVRLFSSRALCGYGVWKRQFYAGGSRRHSHAAVRRSYFSFLTMDDTDYEAEVAVLRKNRIQLAEFVATERPSIGQVKKCHWELVAEKFWNCCVANTMVWIDKNLVPAYKFSVDDLFEAYPFAVISNGEADAIVASVVKSLDVSADNVLKALTDIVQPDAEVVMARNLPIDIELQMENDVSARTCQWCG
jgi:hypothetical protein